MKKFLAILIAAVVLATLLAIPGLAAGGSAAVTSATGASGETVTLTLSLAGFENATGLGVTVTGLPLESGSAFSMSGGFGEFYTSENQGAWMSTGNAVSVNGAVAVLKFKVPAYSGQKNYPITVLVDVRNDDGLLGTVTAYGSVTVNNPTQSISLDKTTLALDMSGTKTATLAATLTPANATDSVVWTSSDSTVVSVANGTVTALKAGSATITATAGGKSATCAVTVTCSHTGAVETKANEPTCQATGNNAYYTCSGCNKVLKADKTTVTTVAAETLAKVDHKGGTATCTAQAVCSMCNQGYGEKKAHSFAAAWQSDANQHWHICTSCNTEKSGLAAHSYEWKVDEEATEDKTGLKHEECVCGAKKSLNTVIDKLDHVHKGITKHNAVAATCTKTGTVQYWTCSSSKCDGKFYGDASCQILLETIEAPINPDKHTGKTSYEFDDDQHWKLCSDCKGIVGQKQNHNWNWVVDKAATEAATGLKHEACATCKAERSKDTQIEKLKHNPVKVAGKDATCTEEGALEHFFCQNCNGYYASNNGALGAKIAKDSVISPALGHTFSEEWAGDGNSHWHICSVCEEASEKEAHTTELVGAVEATEETEGYTGDEVCTVCQTVVAEGETVPMVTEPTEPPTEAPTVAPTEPAAVTPAKQKVDIGLVVAIVIVVAAIGGAAIFMGKKK